MNIETRITHRRRCGLRRPGGFYLVAAGPAQFCGKLPIPLEICPCCGRGIKPSRGWTWVDATRLFAGEKCKAPKCVDCPMAKGLGRAGLLWIGTCYYPSPQTWTEEALALGVCRRIPAVPNDFKLGTTWVLVAHRQAITKWGLLATVSFGKHGVKQIPAVFHAFKPTAIEYLVTGSETQEELDKLAARGITPVKDQLPATGSLPFAAGAADSREAPTPPIPPG